MLLLNSSGVYWWICSCGWKMCHSKTSLTRLLICHTQAQLNPTSHIIAMSGGCLCLIYTFFKGRINFPLMAVIIKSTILPKIFFILIDVGLQLCDRPNNSYCVCRWLIVVKFRPGSLQLGWGCLLIASILLLRFYYPQHACVCELIVRIFFFFFLHCVKTFSMFCRHGNHFTHERIQECIFSGIYHICIHTRLCNAELISSSSCLPICQTENMLIMLITKLSSLSLFL